MEKCQAEEKDEHLVIKSHMQAKSLSLPPSPLSLLCVRYVCMYKHVCLYMCACISLSIDKYKTNCKYAYPRKTSEKCNTENKKVSLENILKYLFLFLLCF